MANEIKGEFKLDVGDGDDKETYRLVLDVNALCEAEGVTGVKSANLPGALQIGDMRLLRNVLYVATRRFHGDLSVDDCGDLIMEVSPNMMAATLLLGLNRAFPAPKKGGEGAANPRRRRKASETVTA